MSGVRFEIAPATSPQVMPRLALTPDQAAEALGVSRDTLERHILHELRVVRRGRRILISVSELERWLDANSTTLFGSRRG